MQNGDSIDMNINDDDPSIEVMASLIKKENEMIRKRTEQNRKKRLRRKRSAHKKRQILKEQRKHPQTHPKPTD